MLLSLSTESLVGVLIVFYRSRILFHIQSVALDDVVLTLRPIPPALSTNVVALFPFLEQGLPLRIRRIHFKCTFHSIPRLDSVLSLLKAWCPKKL